MGSPPRTLILRTLSRNDSVTCVQKPHLQNRRTLKANCAVPRCKAAGGMADGAGFEPAVPLGTHAFQACTIDHSVTHPSSMAPKRENNQ